MLTSSGYEVSEYPTLASTTLDNNEWVKKKTGESECGSPEPQGPMGNDDQAEENQKAKVKSDRLSHM